MIRALAKKALALCLLFVSLNARADLRPTFELKAHNLFPLFERDRDSRDLQKWWFGEGRVVLNTMTLGSAPDAEMSHEVSVSGPLSTFDPNDPDVDWRGSLRSVLYLATDTSRPVSISVRHGLWFHFYRNAGYFSQNGPRSYRDLKHQLRIAAEARLVDKQLSLYFPIYLQQARYSNFREDSRWNGRWRYSAWVAPELIYRVNDRWTVSAFYETDTLVGSDLKRFYFWDSIAEGEAGVRFSCTL